MKPEDLKDGEAVVEYRANDYFCYVVWTRTNGLRCPRYGARTLCHAKRLATENGWKLVGVPDAC